MIKNNNHHQIENFAGENFSSEKYYYDLVEGMPFTFNRKKERLKDVKNIPLLQFKFYFTINIYLM